MKRYEYSIFTLLFALAFCFATFPAEAQLLRRIKDEVKNRAENKVVRDAGNATESAMDRTMGKAAGALKGDGKEETTAEERSVPEEAETGGPEKEISSVSTVTDEYQNYDFVPGDRIIFQPDLREEADAELPARFIVLRGNAEIQTYEGEKILHLDKGGYVTLAPLMEKENQYLPEQFTVEFDLMWENPKEVFESFNQLKIFFFKPEDSNPYGYGLYEFGILDNTRTAFSAQGTSQTVVSEAVKTRLNTNGQWHHVALYVRQNIGKAYIGGTRVQATNNLPRGAGKLILQSDGRYGYKIKNFRIAGGGDDKYQKIVTDGGFVTHGIMFDVNQAAIKPESTGALKEIVKLMQEHGDLKFEIRGHTDSDGSTEVNQKLSEARAEAVREKLVSLGIEPDRLTAKGMGAAQPIDRNDNPEGKANNRRVEFVKI